MEWPDKDFPLSTSFELFRSAYTRREPRPSQFQRDVSAMVRQMGWEHNFEHVTVEGISLDLAEPVSKCAVEVDGPCHYLKDVSRGGYIVNGATRLKSRLLWHQGWKVVHVSFFEWRQRSMAMRRELLREQLARIEVATTSGS